MNSVTHAVITTISNYRWFKERSTDSHYEHYRTTANDLYGATTFSEEELHDAAAEFASSHNQKEQQCNR